MSVVEQYNNLSDVYHAVVSSLSTVAGELKNSEPGWYEIIISKNFHSACKGCFAALWPPQYQTASYVPEVLQ